MFNLKLLLGSGRRGGGGGVLGGMSASFIRDNSSKLDHVLEKLSLSRACQVTFLGMTRVGISIAAKIIELVPLAV